MITVATISCYMLIGVACWLWLWLPVLLREIEASALPKWTATEVKQFCLVVLPVTMVMWPFMIPAVLIGDKENRVWYRIYKDIHANIKRRRDVRNLSKELGNSQGSKSQVRN